MNIKQSFDSLNLISNSPSNIWEEAYPLGNGTLGAVVYGGTDKELISLNHDTLWTGYPRTNEFRGSNEAYVKARALVREGKYPEAQQTLKEGFSSYGSEAYMPMGDMEIEFHENGRISSYRRRLDLSKAINTVTYKQNGKKFIRESFVSHPNHAFVMKITCEGGTFDFDIKLTSLLYSGVFTEGDIIAVKGECPLNSQQNIERTDRTRLYDETRHGMGFMFAATVSTDGKKKSVGDRISITGATDAVILLCAETSFNGYEKDPAAEAKEYKKACTEMLKKVSGKEYSALKRCHIRDYRKYFSRLKLNLGSDGLGRVPTKVRMERYEQGSSDSALPALLFNFGRYLTIAASRSESQPMNLQGIWNHRFMPPWHSNYTVNINTEMNYFPTLAANLAEMYEPLVKMAEELSVTGTVTAKKLYHAPGWVCHHNTDLWRHTQPVAGDPVYSFWCAGSGWLCHAIYEYFEYTLDIGYLKRIYPVMQGAAEFYLSQLETLPNGKRAVFPSTSPENNYLFNNSKAAVSETAEMTMAIVRELFGNILKSAKLLGIENEITESIKKELPCLHQPVIASDGRLCEWYGEHPDAEIHHRHVSHLYGLHPGNGITPKKTPELAEACKKTLETRGDDGTGWSLAWKSNFWARLGDGNRAMRLIRRQLNLSGGSAVNMHHGGSYPNLLCAHPPFQIDGNFGALSGMLEMLVQSDSENVYICPALPDEWKNIEVSGIRAKGNKEVEFRVIDGEIKDLKIIPLSPLDK